MELAIQEKTWEHTTICAVTCRCRDQTTLSVTQHNEMSKASDKKQGCLSAVQRRQNKTKKPSILKYWYCSPIQKRRVSRDERGSTVPCRYAWRVLASRSSGRPAPAHLALAADGSLKPPLLSKPKMLFAALLHFLGATPQLITTLSLGIRNISEAVLLNLPILSCVKISTYAK